MADGRSLKAVGVGDLQLELLNGSGKMKVVFKDAIHAPAMAFTLISISQLDKAGFFIIFKKGMCTIKNLKGQAIRTIPHSDGLYKIATDKHLTTSKTANATSVKMLATEAHKKFGYTAFLAIKYAISNGLITGIELNPNSKPDFCEACAKAKLACQPFPKESKTRAEKFGK